MKTLGNPPRGILTLVPTAPSVIKFAVAERCSAARLAAPRHTVAPLPPARRSTAGLFATNGSAGNRSQRSSFILPKTKTRL
jgi:hypothetical protein